MTYKNGANMGSENMIKEITRCRGVSPLSPSLLRRVEIGSIAFDVLIVICGFVIGKTMRFSHPRQGRA